jgi:glycosyltransferase involved in cell wall biosynthesis
LVLLVEGLIALGHAVDVAYLLDGPHAARLRRSGARLHAVSRGAPLGQIGRIGRIARDGGAELVHTWLQRMGAVGGVAARLCRLPWVYGERSVPGREVGWRRAVRQQLAVVEAAAIVANSDTAAAEWRRLVRDPARVGVVPNALDLEALSATEPVGRDALGVPEDAELVLYAGRFVPPKNIPLLGHALAQLLALRPRAHALLCGEGHELPALRATLGRAGVGARGHALGYREDLWALLKTADLLVLPSLHEGRPNVVLEAIACGCPVVLSDIPSHRECVPADGALFFPPTDAAEAARALARCLEDRDAARARAVRARARLDVLTVSTMARAYERLYQRLVPPKPHRRALG